MNVKSCKRLRHAKKLWLFTGCATVFIHKGHAKEFSRLANDRPFYMLEQYVHIIYTVTMDIYMTYLIVRITRQPLNKQTCLRMCRRKGVMGRSTYKRFFIGQYFISAWADRNTQSFTSYCDIVRPRNGM